MIRIPFLVPMFAFSMLLASYAMAAGPVEPAPKPVPHCQVPCGIYTDQQRGSCQPHSGSHGILLFCSAHQSGP